MFIAFTNVRYQREIETQTETKYIDRQTERKAETKTQCMCYFITGVYLIGPYLE